MNSRQLDMFERVFEGFLPVATGFCHGDCIGADEQAHNVVLKYKIPICIYPPNKRIFRSNIHNDLVWSGTKAKCFSEWGTLFILDNGNKIIFYSEDDYLKRNRKIIKKSDVLIATPGQKEEQLRSGTWATIRYARKRPIAIWRIAPDTTINTDNREIYREQMPLL